MPACQTSFPFMKNKAAGAPRCQHSARTSITHLDLKCHRSSQWATMAAQSLDLPENLLWVTPSFPSVVFCCCSSQLTSLEEFTSTYTFTERKFHEQQDEKTLLMFSFPSEAPNQITGLYLAPDNAGSSAKFINRHLSVSSQAETNTGTTHRR